MTYQTRLSSYQSIIEAAYRIWGDNPRASLAEIALAAGVGRATLHRHFQGRDELYRALCHQAVKDLEDAANAAAKTAWTQTDAMKKILHAVVAIGDRQQFLMNGVIDKFPELQAELDRQNTEFMQVIKAAQKEGLYPRTCPAEWVMQSYDMMIYAAWQMVKDQHATPKQAANLAWSTFKAGLKKARL